MSGELVQAMVAARLGDKALARKAALPLSTIRRAMKNDPKLAPGIVESLLGICKEEADANAGRAAPR